MIARVLSAALMALTLVAAAPAAQAAPGDEPSPTDPLQQTIDPDQEVAEGEAVLGVGHVDLGPKFVDGEWKLMIHDDTRLEGSVWRYLDDTALTVADSALQTVPDDPAYAFLGVDPGTDVHVVPQTQNLDVVWLGWNTQDPEVRETVDRGVTLSLEAVEGPGRAVVYLQDGGFGEPDVLWDSELTEQQPLWVDVNTHTHANWVFTEPGVYLVTLTAAATTVGGEEESSTETVRIAVGDGTDPQEALAADPPVAGEGTADAAAEDTPAADSTTDEDADGAVWIWAIAGAAALLVVALVALVLRSRRTRERAIREEQP